MAELVETGLKGTKELHEVGVALAKVLQGVIEAKADGDVTTAELLSLVTESFESLSAAVDGAQKIGDEVAELPGTAVLGGLAPLAPVLDSLAKKKAPEPSA